MLHHQLQPETASYLPQNHAESTSIPGYKPLLLVSADTQTLLYRSLREKDGTRHLVRTHKAGHPCAGFRALIQRKYEMLGNLPVDGILRRLGLVESAAGPALILEDFNGITLEDILSVDCMGTKTFLQLGSRICTILSQIHENKIIHGDLNPRNILVNSKTGEVKITGFRRALYFSEALCPACDIDCLKGNQTYISPEQTGRINQPLDCRSDLYSLGAVFYHILAGAPPFLSDDPLELAYQHIAKEPELPETVNSEIPATISGILMKLLSKSPCDRYQSAQGLKGDLQECLALLETSGGFTGFAPGRHDASSTFCLPKKLYGRQQEIASLMGSFGRIASGAREMLLISGYSGIGKSSLVHEVRSRIAMQNGYFITGKFDQFKVDIPFSALIEAFRGMVRQILCESDKMITNRKERLQDELGRNLRVIIDVIPEVALITGEQPPLPELPPKEAENRFHSACNKFIRVLSGDTHPLVIFLDDLQWVDPASLKLLLSIVTDPALTHLLVIGAFRDNEMEPSNILTYTLNEIYQRGTIINRIIMTPLSEQHVSQLIADTMHCDLDKARPLAEMVMQKTGGSPFFARRFLQNLHEEGLLVFDFGSGTWQWNLARIQAKGMTDNVVELIAGNLLRLSPATGELLTQAACICKNGISAREE